MFTDNQQRASSQAFITLVRGSIMLVVSCAEDQAFDFGLSVSFGSG